MSLKQWEQKVLETPDAETRVQEIEDELRLAVDLSARRAGDPGILGCISSQ